MPKFDEAQLKSLIEAAIFVSERPLSIEKLRTKVLSDWQLSSKYIRQIIESIVIDYDTRGIRLVEVASGWRFQSVDYFSPWLARLWKESAPKYSQALLEILALIAYRQPITRGEIEEIRGVAVSSQSIKTLSERQWIKIVGHKPVPGRPAIYATTPQFLDYFSLQSLSDLPTSDLLTDMDTQTHE